jgi:GntR family transcriptional regulator, vanillate catabolism transcriptional regulator
MTDLAKQIEEAGASQTTRAQLALRELLLSGAIRPGERLSEQMIVDRIGISRTPVRAALITLAEEGLLEPIPSGGYAARAFTERDILDSIEIRGTTEGLAARLAAERGGSSTALQNLRDLVDRLDDVVAGIESSAFAFETYIEFNARLHRDIVLMAESRVLERQIERVMALPFASPSAFAMVQAGSPEARQIIIIAQDQHRAVVEAISQREGTRAEALMREHSRLAGRNLGIVMRSQAALAKLPGAALIRFRG